MPKHQSLLIRQVLIFAFAIHSAYGQEAMTDRASRLNELTALLTEFKEAVETNSKPRFRRGEVTNDAQKAIAQIWDASEMICQQPEINEKCLTRTEGGYQIRNIPVTLLQADESSKYKQIVVNFTPNGIVDNIVIALETEVYSEIIDHSESVEDFRRRQIIIDFIENYRTSYNRKDIGYVESVFSDNALIITGKVVKEQPRTDGAMRSLGTERITYVKQNKKEYITKLARVFKQNNYINVQFDQIEVLRHPKHENMYGVTLLQGWNTTNYSDVGYLFLLVDFKDSENPLIHVRTWQPNEFQGRPLPEEAILGMHNFSIEDIIY